MRELHIENKFDKQKRFRDYDFMVRAKDQNKNEYMIHFVSLFSFASVYFNNFLYEDCGGELETEVWGDE